MPSARHDVFVSYNSSDTSTARELASVLVERGLQVFFDEWELIPGRPWQEALENAIETARSVAVLYGPSGVGPWENREMRASLQRFVRSYLPIIPVLLPGTNHEPELPLFLSAFTWVDLSDGLTTEGIDRLVWGITGKFPSSGRKRYSVSSPRARLWNVPRLPREYQPRGEIEHIRRSLLSPEPQTSASLGQHACIAVYGMGGCGKTVLATALARDPDVELAFPGGVFWLTLGQQPEAPLLLQERLASAVHGSQVTPKSIEDGKAILRGLFAWRPHLLVLDDVWNPRDVEPFDILGTGSKLLVTTRKNDVCDGIGAASHIVRELPIDDALELLARYAGLLCAALPAEAPALVRECGELPLALAMAGSMLRGRPADRWPSLLARFRSADLARVGRVLPQYPYSSLLAAIEVSVEDLPPATRVKYLDLAVFPEDATIPEGVLHTFWGPDGIDEMSVQEHIDALLDHALLRRDAKGRLVLHDLQCDYVRARTGELNLPALHRRLLRAYRLKEGPEGLHTVQDDGYFFQHIAYHLLAAEGADALRALLLDVHWLATKLARSGINSLLADFNYLDLSADLAADLVCGALRLSSHVLNQNPGELQGQLIGRLNGEDQRELLRFIDAARRLAPRPALVPLWPCLVPSGGPLLRTLDHESDVNAIAIGPNGLWALSGADDGTLKRWNLATGELWRIFGQTEITKDGAIVVGGSSEHHLDSVQAVAISHNGEYALSGGVDCVLIIWDIERGTAFRSYRYPSRISAIAISSDDMYALVGCDDGTLTFRDLSSREELRSFGGHSGSVRAVAISPDGKHALSGSADQTLVLWELFSGRLVHSFTGHREAVRTVAISPDGRHAVSGSYDKTLRLWDLTSREFVCSFEGHQGGVIAVDVSPDGRYILSGAEDKTLKLWDVATGKFIRSYEGHQARVTAVAITSSGQQALSGCEDGTLKLWDLTSRKITRPLESHRRVVRAVAFDPDMKYVLSGSDDGILHVWETVSGKLVPSRSYPGWAQAVGGASELTSYGDASVLTSHRDEWDDQRSTVAAYHYVSEQTRTRSIAQSGRRVSVISPDGKYALTGSESGFALQAARLSEPDCLLLHDLVSGELIRSFKGPLRWMRAAAISPSGKFVLSGGRDNTLIIWDLASGKLIHSIRVDLGAVQAVAISANGRHALSASDKSIINLWDVMSGELLRTLEGHEADVNAIAISGDGKTALSGSDDRTLKLWDMTTGKLLNSFTGEAAISALAYHADGRHIAAGDTLGRVHLFEVLLEHSQDR